MNSLVYQLINCIAPQVDSYEISVESDWKNSKIETVAEEFRIITSSKLGDKSFKPYKSKTRVKLEKNEMQHLIDKLSK